MTRQSLAFVKSKNTKPEKVVRSALFAIGKRFRIHVKELPGSPDVVLPRYKMVIFVHGCFWHRHPGCKFAYVPKTNKEFWSTKFRQNQERDVRNEMQLKELGFHCVIIWECETKQPLLLQNKLRLLFE
ncbi:very short patch repair endonuclease [Verrucomicrobia bacterium]|nr:very short patch repair endonuclease [Verrucomicrobiota bacterium]